MTATPDFSIRMQVAGMRGLLSEIIAVGALSKHGDTDLMERVREAADTPLPELPTRQCLAQIEEPAGAAPAAVAHWPQGEYPPLPEPVADWVQRGSVSTGGGSLGHEIGREGVFTAAQMRAYFDQGRQAAPALEAPAALLTKPALVGGGSFGVGVPERYVIEAAQRHHEREGQREAMTAEQFADEERKRRTLWELIHGPLAAAPQAPAAPVEFQQRVQPWLMACFGAEIAADRAERNHRFLEEALELVQACGCTASEAHQLVDYVFGRPLGEPAQEVGGVMVTLAALCLANSLDMHKAGEVELQRIWGKVEQIRAKQAAKPKHSPLPAAPAAPAVDAKTVEDAERFRAMGRAVLGERGAMGRYPELGDDATIDDVRAVFDAAIAAQAKEGGASA